MIEDQKILTVSAISKQFHKLPENEPLAKVGWSSLLESLFRTNKKPDEPEIFNALSEVSFSLNKGQSLGIIGLNGSGKSTLLQIISGTMQPSTGTVSVNGRVAALLELGSGFNPDFTGIENIKLSASLHGINKNEFSSKLKSIIEFAAIGDFIYQPVKTYSSGMSLRLAFALAAHIEAEILIIDEALSVGDAKFQIKCFSYLEKFKEQGGSLIIVSHDLNSIARLCENSLLINKGQLIEKGRSINVINEYSRIISEELSDNENNNCLSKNVIRAKSSKIMENEEVCPLSYGGRLGIIENVMINNQESALLQSGELFTVSFEIKSNSFIEKPIFALRIRDTLGQEIYGTNSKLLNIDTPNLKKNDKLIVHFTQPANLGSGEYFISIGFTYYEDDNLRVIHRLRECSKFGVYNVDGSFGITNCFSKVLIQNKL